MGRALNLLTIWVLSCGGVGAADWPQFRGPRGAGVSEETGVAERLEMPSSVRWKAALPGQGVSSPLVVGERVFLTCSSGPRQERLHVVCFDARDGSIRWERQFWATGRTMCHEKTAVAAPTPASDRQRVYALFSSGDVFGLDHEGNLVWLRGLGLDYRNANNSLGMASSPLVTQGVLIVQLESDSQSLALGVDVGTGTNRWKLDRPRQANWTSPVLVQSGTGNDLVALQSSAGITAVDPLTGQAVWTYGGGAATIPSSIAHGPRLYVPSHGITALHPDPAGGSARQLWRASQLRPDTASPLLLGDRLYVVNSAGVLTCAGLADGTRLWQLRLKGPFSSSPVAAGHYLLLFNEKGLGQVVDLSGQEGNVVRQLDLGETIIGTPALAHGAMYVRSDQHLWKLAEAPSR